ncbi:MAG: hypothetical protein AAF730_04360 [Bacteroidota bacterium]
MKKTLQAVPVAALSASASADAPRLVYSAPKLNALGNIASISKVSLSRAFFFGSDGGGTGNFDD